MPRIVWRPRSLPVSCGEPPGRDRFPGEHLFHGTITEPLRLSDRPTTAYRRPRPLVVASCLTHAPRRRTVRLRLFPRRRPRPGHRRVAGLGPSGPSPRPRRLPMIVAPRCAELYYLAIPLAGDISRETGEFPVGGIQSSRRRRRSALSRGAVPLPRAAGGGTF